VPKYQSVLEIISQAREPAAQPVHHLRLSRTRPAQRRHALRRDVPGLLTDGIDQAASYIFRGIVADSVRGLQFLLTRRELDPRVSSW